MNLRRNIPLLLAPLALIAASCGDDESGDAVTTDASGTIADVVTAPTSAATDAAATTGVPEPTTPMTAAEDAAATTTEAGAATTAAGADTTAPGAAPTAGGADTTAGGAATTAAGADTTAAGADTTAAGADTTAAGADTTAAGADTTTAGADTTAEGAATTTAGSATTVAASTAPTGAGGSIVVGSADFPESQLLAQIYGQALAEAGYDVSYQLSIGSREIYYSAIEGGEVDLVPEYTNALLSFVLRQDDPNAVPEATNVEEQVVALEQALPETLQVLEPSTAEDKDVIVCRAEVAEEHDLTNLTDLAGVLDQIRLGAPPEFEGRSPFGVAGFMQLLDAPAPLEFVPLDVSAVADALSSGAIDCGNLFSTMSVITTEGFVALEDDQTLVPNEAVLPLIRTDAVDDTVVATLDEVDQALDTDTLKELMVNVEVDAQAPDVVAAEWLATL